MPKITIGNRIYNYTPEKNALYMIKMAMRIKSDESFRNIFRYNLTNHFLSSVKDTIETGSREAQNQSTVLSISGIPGTGKSVVVMTLGLQLFPHFSHRNVFFFDQEILDHAHEFPENTLVVRDENPAPAIFGVGSQRISAQTGLLADTTRKAGLNLAFIEPHFRQNDVTKYYLEMIDMDRANRITRMGLKDETTFKYLGAVYIRILPENHPEWIAYNEYKDDFIKNVKAGKLGQAKADYDKMVENIYEKIDIDLYNKKKERKVFIMQEYPSLTNAEIDIISTLLEVKLRQA